MESENLDDEKFTTPRPVARPLQASLPEQSQAKVIVLDDDQPQVAACDLRARRIAELKAQILELESMQGELQTSAGSGPGLFSKLHNLTIIYNMHACMHIFHCVLYMHLSVCVLSSCWFILPYLELKWH